MRAKAIVIGIDQYPREEWCLEGAVRDALSFARWAVDSGGVKPADLSLHLSPLANAPPTPADLAASVASASWDGIAKALSAYKLDGKGNDADRLYFFYAGHGLAAPAQAPSAGPLLVPADTDDIDFYVDNRPIGMEAFRTAMQDQSPGEQIYFVDACRDVLPVTSNKVLTQQYFWNFQKVTDEQLATQAVLLATAAGEKAKEIRGRGVFTRLLLKALTGLGPDLVPPLRPNPAAPRRRLVFRNLVGFVRLALKRELGDASAQVPFDSENKRGGDLTLAEFAAAELPTTTITFLVTPALARQSGRIEFMQWSEADNDYIARSKNPEPAKPPLAEQTPVRIFGGTHYVRITARDFEDEMPELDGMYDEKRIEVRLRPRPPSNTSTLPQLVTRSLDAAVDFGDDAGLESFQGTPAPTRGSVEVSANDRLARVAIFDPRGVELARSYGAVTATQLLPGPYRVTAELTADDRVEERVLVDGTAEVVTLKLAAPSADPLVLAELRQARITVDGAESLPSENFGTVSGARLSSMLAYAAWASRFPPEAGFDRLRSFGIDPLSGLPVGSSAVHVIIADAHSPNEPVSVTLELPGMAPAANLMLTPLPGFALASQATFRLTPTDAFVRVVMSGLMPVTVALRPLPGFIAVLIISREQGNDVEIQQYLNPIDPRQPIGPGFGPPLVDDVRLVELSWRALQGGRDVDAIEFRGLLEGKRSNPLLAVIAGYRMLGTARASEFSGPPDATRKVETAGPSALWNLVSFFPDLPDAHVLAALYDPKQRDLHFERAAERGTPVIGTGFSALAGWMIQRSTRALFGPPELRRTLLPGVPWTAWADPRGDAAEPRIVNSRGRTYRDQLPIGEMRDAATSVGRVEIGSRSGSCFLIAPNRALTTLGALSGGIAPNARGEMTLRPGFEIRVHFGHGGPGIRVMQVIPYFAALREALEQPIVLVLEESVPATSRPAVLAATPLRAGQRIALIGYPLFDLAEHPEAFAAHFAAPIDEQHVMLGTVTYEGAPGGYFEYDACSANGTLGGPVVDVATGSVLGIHANIKRSTNVGFVIAGTSARWPDNQTGEQT